MKNPIKISFNSEWPALLALLLSGLSSFYFYYHLPNPAPIHWNVAGQADGYGSPWSAAFMMLIVMVFMYALFLLLPWLDPQGERYQQFSRPYHIFKNLLVVFMSFFYFIANFKAMGYNLAIEKIMPASIGILFVLLGNYFGKIKGNWFFGIKTPWTLSSEEVWNKTHRYGGWFFIAGGFLMMAMGWLPSFLRLPLLLADVAVLSFGSIFLSWWFYRQEKNKK